MRSNDASRWYGALVAVVSGLYSISMSVWGPGMTSADWLMLVLGGVVLGHGVALFGQVSTRLDETSGVLMIVYAVLMLLNQVWMGAANGGPMFDGTMGGPMMGDAMGWSMMAWDPGMTALAVVMLGSGLIMTSTNGAST